MKKIILIAVVAILGSPYLMAQRDISSEESKKEQKNNVSSDSLQSGMYMTVVLPEDGWGLQYEIDIFNFFIGGGLGYGKTNNVVTDNSNWNILGGFHYTYFLTKALYVDARAGVGYGHSSIRFKGGAKESNGDVFLHISPRIGYNFFSNGGLVVGYGWNFTKFKFSKEYKSDYFFVGIRWGF